MLAAAYGAETAEPLALAENTAAMVVGEVAAGALTGDLGVAPAVAGAMVEVAGPTYWGQLLGPGQGQLLQPGQGQLLQSGLGHLL